jgi:DNA end-binding protein Ku
MRSVWKGTIGFGAAAIPVKAYAATEEHGTGLHQLHASDGGRIRQKRICEIDGAEVPYAEISKGYELPDGDVVILSDEDLATLPLPTLHSIEVCAFAPLEQVDPIYFAKSYYLEPEVTGVKPYVLLSEALQQSGLVAVVKIAIRQRETLGVLRVRDQVIVLATMLWPDEIRTPEFPFLHQDVDVRLPELRAAVASIEQLAGNFAPRQYADGYREALTALINAKAEGAEVVRPTEVRQDAGVVDLMTAFQESVDAATPTPAEDMPDIPAPATRETAVRRARTAAKKAAAAKDDATNAAAKVTKPRSGAKARR